MTEHVHFIGIGGAGMSAIARILARTGVSVGGSDSRDSATLHALKREHGISISIGHRAENIAGASLVVYSAAVSATNPELFAAREADIETISRATMLGRLMSRYSRSIAISGTHGKTTTTGMTACILEAAGMDPTVLIGGDLPAYGGNARLGSGDVFLAEACEAYDSFLELHPTYAVITNIEADHLDYYGDLNGVLRSFRRFLAQVDQTAVVCGYDRNIAALLSEPEGFPSIVTFGLYDHVAVRASEIQIGGLQPSYTLSWRGELLGRIQLNVPGMHNITNSLAAAGVALQIGATYEQVRDGLAAFTGTGRRFEKLGVTPDGVLVIDDYAHHPTELRATLDAVRDAFPDRRIVAAFQPHLPSRTRDFREEFAESFGKVDQVVLTDIYLAREEPIEGVTGAGLAALTADRRGAGHVTYVPDASALPSRLAEITRSGDVLILLGAGDDVRKAAHRYLSQYSTPTSTLPVGSAS